MNNPFFAFPVEVGPDGERFRVPWRDEQSGLSTPPDLDQPGPGIVYASPYSQQFPDEWLVLKDAVAQDDLERFKGIFENEGLPNSLIDRLINFNATPMLSEALDAGSGSIAAYLVYQKVPFNDLHVGDAVSKALVSVLQAFLDQGWDINESANAMKIPPLAGALSSRSTCEWFLSHGADPNAQCDFGWTPLTEAVTVASREMIDLLFQHGGSIEQGELMNTAVHRTQSDWPQILNLLLEKGADINRIKYHNNHLSTNHFNWMKGLGTPLHEAVGIGRVDVVKYLLNHGADPRLRDTWNHLPIDIAYQKDHHEILDLLRPFWEPYEGEPLWLGVPKAILQQMPGSEDTIRQLEMERSGVTTDDD